MLIHQAPVAIAFFGPDLRFRRVNAALGEVIGKPDADHADKLPSEIWPEDLAARAEAALRKVLADGTSVTESGYPQGSNSRPGETLPPRPPLTASWFPVRDGDGQIAGVGLILIEGSGPAAEEEIRRSEERYRSLVQGGAQVVWVAGPDGAMKEDSPEWRWITG